MERWNGGRRERVVEGGFDVERSPREGRNSGKRSKGGVVEGRGGRL